jgi:hypothetical protein
MKKEGKRGVYSTGNTIRYISRDARLRADGHIEKKRISNRKEKETDEDDFEYGVEYSMDKKKRWELANELLEREIEEEFCYDDDSDGRKVMKVMEEDFDELPANANFYAKVRSEKVKKEKKKQAPTKKIIEVDYHTDRPWTVKVREEREYSYNALSGEQVDAVYVIKQANNLERYPHWIPKAMLNESVSRAEKKASMKTKGEKKRRDIEQSFHTTRLI